MIILRSSGTIKSDSEFPFTVINKLATTLVQLNSCAVREEESIYEFTTYSLQRKELRQINEAIRQQFDYASLNVANRRILGIIWNGQSFSEIQSGIFCGKIRYQVLAEKDLTSQSNLDTIDGATFLECLYKRYLNSEVLKYKINGFYLSNFGKDSDEYPFITTSDIEISEGWRHTCGQVEQTNFSFRVWGKSAAEVEQIKEYLMDEYDYINMNINDRIFYSMNWQGDTLLETDANIWVGEVDYQLVAENPLG